MTDFSKYNLTPSSKNALIKAQEIASEYKHLKVIDIHLFCSILTMNHNNIDFALEVNGFLKSGLLQTIELVLEQYKEHKRKRKFFAPEIFEILNNAQKLAKKNKDEFIGIDHILVAMLTTRRDSYFFVGLNLDIDVFVIHF